MKLNEFREVIKNNTEEMVNEINTYLVGIEGSTSENFRNEKYDFSWSSLTREMKNYFYGYSKKENIFIKLEENKNENNNKNTFSIDKKFDDYNSTLTTKINKEVLDKFKSFCNEYNMISQAYIISKLLSEIIDKYDNK